MTKKIRLILFFLFTFLYLIIVPLLLFYSFGYRLDWKNKKIVGTGCLYLKVWPREATVLIDHKKNKKAGFFLNEIIIQGLPLKKYTITVKNEDYFPWEKTLEILPKVITKIDNVTLIKEKIMFEEIKREVGDFYFSPKRDLILLFDLSKKIFLIINSQTKETLNSFSLPNNDIKIISWDENLKTIILKSGEKYFSLNYNKKGGIDKLNQANLTDVDKENLAIDNNNLNLITNNGLTFEKRGNYFYLLNKKTNDFEKFFEAKNIIFSPDKSKFLFYNDYEIFYSNSDKPLEKIFLQRFSKKIQDCFWLNNYYLIFNVGGQIKIMETDTRDKINIVDLPQKITTNEKSKMFFDEINKKLYILEENTLFVSEPLTDKANK